MKLDKLITGLKAAGEPTRCRLLVVLARAELTVSELTRILGQSQPRISRHLRLLCEAELLERFREGSWVFYRLMQSDEDGSSIATQVLNLLDADDVALQGDLDRLEQVREARRQEAAAYFADAAGEWEDLRSRHAPERDVENAMLDLVGQKKIENLLDIGTGTGRMLELFSPIACSALGIDLSHEMLAIARTKIEAAGLENCQVRQGDLFALDVANGNGLGTSPSVGHGAPTDLITLHQVLHYLPDPALAIGEAARVLNPGGRLLIADFAPHDLEHLREKHSHRRLGFADDEVVAWCKAAGLEDITVRHLPPPDDTKDALTVTLWLATSRQSAQRGPST